MTRVSTAHRTVRADNVVMTDVTGPVANASPPARVHHTGHAVACLIVKAKNAAPMAVAAHAASVRTVMSAGQTVIVSACPGVKTNNAGLTVAAGPVVNAGTDIIAYQDGVKRRVNRTVRVKTAVMTDAEGPVVCVRMAMIAYQASVKRFANPIAMEDNVVMTDAEAVAADVIRATYARMDSVSPSVSLIAGTGNAVMTDVAGPAGNARTVMAAWNQRANASPIPTDAARAPWQGVTAVNARPVYVKKTPIAVTTTGTGCVCSTAYNAADAAISHRFSKRFRNIQYK